MEILAGNLIIFGGFFLLLVLGIPVAFAIGLMTLAYVVANDIPIVLLVHRLSFALDTFSVLAIPLFILAAQLMNAATITNRIFAFAQALIGHIRGGLGQVNVLGSLVFSGMSGSALADLGGLGQVELRAMKNAGYPRDFSVAITAASSVIGPIFPPSIPIIIYAVLAEVSVIRLLLGGVLPGVLIALVLMGAVYVIGFRRDLPREPRANFKQLMETYWTALPALVTPLILLGGISFGIFSPTEAAMVTVAYALLLGFAYRELSLRRLAATLVETLKMSASVMFIVATAFLFAWVVSVEQLPQSLARYLTEYIHNPTLFLLFLVALVLFLGMFIENMTIMVLLVPIVAPAAASVGVDLVHLGVTFTFAVALGLYTPPVGLGLYLVGKLADMPFEGTVRAFLPFLVPLIVALVLMVLLPQIVLLLPDLLLGEAV